MNRKEALEIAKDFKRCSELCTDYEAKNGDIEFFEYVIKELEKPTMEVPVQEQDGVINILQEQIKLLQDNQKTLLDKNVMLSNMDLTNIAIAIAKISETIHLIKKEALLYSK